MRDRATKSNVRARVSKDEDEAVCPHASRRRAAHSRLRAVRGSLRCAATQHEGRRGPRVS